MFTLFRAGPLAALAMLALAPAPVAAHEFKAGDLLIGHPWTRATPAGAEVAGGYLTITNGGSAADTLTGGTFAAASGFAVHEMRVAGGVMTMRATGPLAIPPHGTLVLSSTGAHAMFTGLKRQLRKGETVAGTLVFEHAGTVPVTYVVDSVGARDPADHGAHDMSGAAQGGKP